MRHSGAAIDEKNRAGTVGSEGDLKSKLADPKGAVLLYGTTPPRFGTPQRQVEVAADKLTARLTGLPLDAIVVYDIQDESGRTQLRRPFPFIKTLDPRGYSALLGSRTGRPPTITYKALGVMAEADWRPWLVETKGLGIDFLSVVGRPTSGPAMSSRCRTRFASRQNRRTASPPR